MSMDEREAIARIIDPSSWRVFDGYLADVKRKYKGQDAAYDPEAFKDKKSLAKADEILALLRLSALQSDIDTLRAEMERLTALLEESAERQLADGLAALGMDPPHTPGIEPPPST